MSEVTGKAELGRDGRAFDAFAFTDEDFRTISKILHQDAGIHLPAAKSTLVYSRLTKRLRALGFQSFRDYCALVASEGGGLEKREMIAALTTNVTSFFREAHHFEHLKKNVLGPRAEAVRRGKKLRIWSAACSSGQEPYSIAMSILSVLPDATNLDVRVLATDIDPNMITFAKTGIYDDDAMQSVPLQAREAYFRKSPESGSQRWQVAEKLSSLIAFRELNLIGRWPMNGQFDAIFCRNVVIYFDEGTQQTIWTRLLPLLTPDGRLYIGHSERVSGSAALELAADGVTAYRVRGRERK